MVDLLEKHEVKISPSILSLKFEDVPDKIAKIEEHIEYIHIDVMDGKFVSNCTDGIEMFDKAKETSNKPLDVHLMVENPIEEVVKYEGAEIITFHIEAVNSYEEALKVIEKIKSLNAKVGVSVKPNTPVNVLEGLLDKIDLVLVMSVEPGYGGQKLIPETIDKIEELRKMGFDKLIEIDGGVTLENSKKIRETSIDIIVAGTAIFGAEDEIEAINKIKGI